MWHGLDLPIAPLTDGELDLRRRPLLRQDAHVRRLARPEPTAQRNARFQRRDLLAAEPVHDRAVPLGDVRAVARIRHVLHEPPVVGEEEQAARVLVQATHGVPADVAQRRRQRHVTLDVLVDRRTAELVRVRDQEAAGLVVHQRDGAQEGEHRIPDLKDRM